MNEKLTEELKRVIDEAFSKVFARLDAMEARLEGRKEAAPQPKVTVGFWQPAVMSADPRVTVEAVKTAQNFRG